MAFVHVDPELTPLAAKIHNSLREHILICGEAPSKARLARSCLCSVVSVYKFEKLLARKGYLTFEKHGIKTMRPTNLDRILSSTEMDPWDELDLDKPKFWRV